MRRIDWPTVAGRGDTVVRVLLLAGFPYALVCDGFEPTTVVWTDGADPAWHVGDVPTWLPWLLRKHEDADVPALAWEEHASPTRATLDVSSLEMHLADAGLGLDGITAAFSTRDVAPYTRLTATASATDTALTVESTAAFPVSGVLHVGRERIEYTSTSPTSFNGCTRGTAGTVARAYLAGDAIVRVYGQPTGLDFEALPSLIGRRATVWVARVDGSRRLVDPTLVFDARVDPGVRVTQTGALALPLRHAIYALASEGQAPTVSLYGYEHGANPRAQGAFRFGAFRGSPLWYQWTNRSTVAEFYTLGNGSGSPDYGGWSSSRELYLERWNAGARALGYSARASLLSSGVVVLRATDTGTDRRLSVWQGWNEVLRSDPEGEGDTRETCAVYSAGVMPSACYWLTGVLHLDAVALAQIPATPSNPVRNTTLDGGPDTVYVYWTLDAERPDGAIPGGRVVSRITASTAAPTVGVPGSVTLTSVLAEGSGDVADNSYLPWVFTRPATAKVGMFAFGSLWWNVLRYGVLAYLDELRGLDQVSDSLDWERLVYVARRAAVYPHRREYLLDVGRPPLEVLRNEALLCGCVLSTWHGRVAMVQIRELAPTEGVDGQLEPQHLRDDGELTAFEVSEGLATGYRVTFEDGSVIGVVDQGAVAESGEGETFEVSMPRGLLSSRASTDPAVQRRIIDVGQGLLAPWVRSYQTITWPGDLRLAGYQIGARLTVTEWKIPNQRGGRGLVAAAALVIGRRVDLDEGTVDLTLRVSAGEIAGYAPEVLIASITGAALTVDTVTAGPQGFADDTNADGTARTDGGASTFLAGDKVQLQQWDTSTPATPFDAVVVSVVGTTITLDAAPGSTWEGLASTGMVALSFVGYADATTAQRRYAFICDGVTYQFPDGSPGRRWV